MPPARVIAAVLVGAALAFACAGRRPEGLGLVDGRLRSCPASPNCVFSGAEDEEHAIAPLVLAVAPEDAWPAVRAAVEALPRTRIVRADEGYLHAECTSRIFRFVDDLELQLRPEEGAVAVRSASRVGHGDMGVNRARVEKLRGALAASGVVR